MDLASPPLQGMGRRCAPIQRPGHGQSILKEMEMDEAWDRLSEEDKMRVQKLLDDFHNRWPTAKPKRRKSDHKKSRKRGSRGHGIGASS